jgi:hypothetical protein
MRDFDECLSSYLETYEADEMFDSFFSAIRKAYIAGYKAAGGEIPKEQPIYELVKYRNAANDKENSSPKK